MTRYRSPAVPAPCVSRKSGSSRAALQELPDLVFYTGCNVLKTPHIALLCLDIMDELGVSYRMMGGPSHCCGVIQFRAGDLDTSSRVSGNTIHKLSQRRRWVAFETASVRHPPFRERKAPAPLRR